MLHRFRARRRPIIAPLLAAGVMAATASPGEALFAQFPIGGRAEAVVVVLNDSVGDPAAVADDLVGRYGGSVERVFRDSFRGWSGRLDSNDLRAAIADPRVQYIEREATFHADEVQSSNVPWGLDRSDQKKLPTDGTFTYTNTGAGVTAYVVDTGIRTSHQEFGGRATGGFDAYDEGGEDCDGHGTHVAGTIGGSTYGIAKQVSLVSVRVLDCDGAGSTSDILAGLDWIVSHHAKGVPAVANLSFSGSTSSSIDSAVKRVIADGVSVVISAGNQNRDACKRSPARVSDALTVAATDHRDRRASFSNYGDCIDLFAPGVEIVSAWVTADDAAAVLSGTSMSSPHVAGVAAQFLQTTPLALPKAVTSAIRSLVVKTIVSSSRTDKDDLLFTNL